MKTFTKMPDVYGLGVYTDTKYRTIFVHPLIKEPLLIQNSKLKTFSLFSQRFFLYLLVYVLSTIGLVDNYHMPVWLPIIISVGLVIIIEIMFYRFCQNQSPYTKFNKDDLLSYEVVCKVQKGKTIGRILTILAIGILMVVNAFLQHYGLIGIIFDVLILILCIIYFVYHLTFLFKK